MALSRNVTLLNRRCHLIAGLSLFVSVKLPDAVWTLVGGQVFCLLAEQTQSGKKSSSVALLIYREITFTWWEQPERDGVRRQSLCHGYRSEPAWCTAPRYGDLPPSPGGDWRYLS